MDSRKNFAYGTVLTAPSPAVSGTTLALAAGNGARFPDPAVDGAFNLVVWPTGVAPLSANAEIVRVTARTLDVLTIVRQQESTSARTILATDQVAIAVTDKTLDDLQAAIANILTVAPADASDALKATASFVCTGVNDDVTVTAALASLPFAGGKVKLLPGNYFAGITATSFIYGVNSKGGLTLEGSGRRQGAIWHVPANTSATCAVKMAATNGGSQTVRDLFITFDDPTGTYCHGIWMQSAELQVYDCCITHSSGHGIILDGEPTVAGGTPVNKGTSGCVRNCEVQQAGSGCSTAFQGTPADGYSVTGLHENPCFEGCFVNGGTSSAAGTLTSALVLGNSYTTLAVTPLTGTFTSGDYLVIGTNTNGGIRQIVTCAADAAVGATSVTVTSFVANFAYPNAQTCFVANYTKMQTRNGFEIAAFSHLHNCHPYFCYQSGLDAFQSSVAVVGGEYETNGWANVNLQGSLTGHLVHISISGIHTYGVVACASIFAFGCRSMVLEGNYVDANIANQALYMQSCQTCIVSSNAFINGTKNRGGLNFGVNMQSCSNCTVTGNIVDDDLTPDSGRIGISVFSCTNMNVRGNIPKVSSGTAMSVASSTGQFSGNIGFNPVGVVTVAVPASTVAVASAVYDRTFYITAGAAATTIALASGPTITLTPSVLNTIRVPAGVTMTPTYVNPPTWVVEGE